MKGETYYRYVYGNKSVFTKINEFQNKETRERFGKALAREIGSWTNRIKKNEIWLFKPDLRKGVKFYFTKLGVEKYERTLFKIHKEMLDHKKTPFKASKKNLNSKKMRKLKINCFIKNINSQEVLYNSKTKRKIGKIIYRDKHQIAIK